MKLKMSQGALMRTEPFAEALLQTFFFQRFWLQLFWIQTALTNFAPELYSSATTNACPCNSEHHMQIYFVQRHHTMKPLRLQVIIEVWEWQNEGVQHRSNYCSTSLQDARLQQIWFNAFVCWVCIKILCVDSVWAVLFCRRVMYDLFFLFFNDYDMCSFERIG